MIYISYKGTVKCEYCGIISFYGYQDKDKICNKCGRGFFRFNAYEIWKLNLGGNKMKKFKLYWLDGTTEIIKGRDAVDAFNSAGIGAGALRALDYYEEVEEEKKDDENKM